MRLKKRKNCTLGDLWKCHTLDGSTADIDKMAPSQSITRRMLAELVKAGRTWDALTEYATVKGWLNLTRQVPKVGEARKYVVQRTGSQLFVRVPVDTLKVKRGQALSVRFNAQNIVVQPAA